MLCFLQLPVLLVYICIVYEDGFDVSQSMFMEGPCFFHHGTVIFAFLQQFHVSANNTLIA